ncbi:unnamed protein product [Paramecium primaurelia]|uniref:DNA 3'-5' helicase n=1 Tax=Paramecium primaurelia TaxID=5886 RepID=A0A8S1ML20_PARPR|nr:unnamed protein product [Paramecium primaurelia]
MANRTYFNLDQKRLFKPQVQLDKKQEVVTKKKVESISINEEPQKQLWDMDLKDCVTKYKDTIGSKKRKEQVIFKPGGCFIKEKSETDKQKSEKELNKEINQVIRQTTKEFFEDIKLEKQQKENEKNQLNVQNQKDQCDVQDQDQKINQQENNQGNQINEEKIQQQKENIEINTVKEDQGLLKKKVGKYQKSQNGNFVRLDLKKKYQDKFRGAIYMNQRKYKRNGTLKNPNPSKREQTQIDFQQLNNQGRAESYNIFIQSVSSGLLVEIFDDEENIKEKEKYDELIKELVQKVLDDLDNKENYLNLLELVFGFTEFREGQFEAIQSILKKESILLVQKTGHGKSLVYQYLSLFLQDSIGIIFSPLISLMIDQVSKLPDQIKGIAYHSMLTSFQKGRLIEFIKGRQVQLVYCTPEIFQSDLGYSLHYFGKISFICIDEAHCVSELSHSFRHTYVILNSMIQNFLKDDMPPFLALTATATHLTVESVLKKFQINKSIISINTERNNIEISVSRDRDVNASLIKLLQSQKYRNLSSILIYCRSKYMVDMVSNYLRNCNLKCLGFHGGLPEQEKMDIQNKFIKNQIQIIVATSIFAMGIDKSDIRAIIHLNLPKSIESYIQEIGRAGRDGQIAYAHLFLRENDFHLERSFILSDYPDFIVMKNLLEKMKQKQEEKKITYFISKFAEENLDLRKDTIYSLMQILERCSDDSIKVYPICHEKIILKFFKALTDEQKEKSTFLNELTKIGRMISGSLHVNVIKASNALSMQPLEVIRQARNLFTELSIATETQEEILPFQIMKDVDVNILEKANEILQLHKQVALDKLNLMYILSYENSVPNYDLLSENLIQTKNFYFNQYFRSENPVDDILKILYDDTIQNINEYLPFDDMDDEKHKQIQQAVKRFLHEETVNKNNSETHKIMQSYLKNPKILSRLFCGIQSIKYSYKEYKSSSIWNKSGRLRYEDVHKSVLNICLQILEQN